MALPDKGLSLRNRIGVGSVTTVTVMTMKCRGSLKGGDFVFYWRWTPSTPKAVVSAVDPLLRPSAPWVDLPRNGVRYRPTPD